MEGTIKVFKLNESFLKIDCENRIGKQLFDHFSYFKPGYQFSTAFKNDLWDGKEKLFNQYDWTLPVGLFEDLKMFAKVMDYEIKVMPTPAGHPIDHVKVSFEEVMEFTNSLNLPFTPYDFQFKYFYTAITKKRGGLISPTGSGKSLIAYMIARWYAEKVSGGKIMIVVPDTGLVEQLYKNFVEFSKGDDRFNPEGEIHTIYSGKPKHFAQNIVITTWQSVYKQPAKWFQQFGCIIGDELHHFKADSLRKIMNKSWGVSYRIGMTGSLDDSTVHELVIKGLFGRMYQFVTTKELQDRGILAKLDIDIPVLQYEQKVKKKTGIKGKGSARYAMEVKWLEEYEPRNDFIVEETLESTGVTLVLFTHIKHGKHLKSLLESRINTGRKVYLVYGNVKTTERERIREIARESDDAIIVASYGTFSTGIDIPAIQKIVLASFSKSQVRVLQSIGRGLRKYKDLVTKLVDICDDIRTGKTKNFSLRHAEARIKIYKQQEFDYSLRTVEIYDEARLL